MMAQQLTHMQGNGAMTDGDTAAKLDELDRILNDPDVPMEPARVWTILAEIAEHQVG